MSQTRPLLKRLYIALLLAGTVVALLPISGLETHNADKVMHILSFFGFAALLDLVSLRSFWHWKVPLLLSYGAFIEIAQALTPWRSFSVADFVADAIGVLLYWLLWKQVLQRMIPHPQG